MLQRSAPQARFAVATLENCKAGCVVLIRYGRRKSGHISRSIAHAIDGGADLRRNMVANELMEFGRGKLAAAGHAVTDAVIQVRRVARPHMAINCANDRR